MVHIEKNWSFFDDSMRVLCFFFLWKDEPNISIKNLVSTMRDTYLNSQENRKRTHEKKRKRKLDREDRALPGLRVTR